MFTASCAKIIEFFSPSVVKQQEVEIACDKLADSLRTQEEPTKYIITTPCSDLSTSSLVIQQDNTTIIGNNFLLRPSRTGNSPNGFIVNAKNFILGRMTFEGFTAPITVSEGGSALIYGVTIKDSRHTAIAVGTSKHDFPTPPTIGKNSFFLLDHIAKTSLDLKLLSTANAADHDTCECTNAIENANEGVSPTSETGRSLVVCSLPTEPVAINGVTGAPGIGIMASAIPGSDPALQGSVTIDVCGDLTIQNTQRGIYVSDTSSVEIKEGTPTIKNSGHFALAIAKGSIKIHESAGLKLIESRDADVCLNTDFLEADPEFLIDNSSALVPNPPSEYECDDCKTCSR